MIDQIPWSELVVKEISKADLCIMGVPFDGAASCGKGASQGPEKMRELSRYLPPATETGIEFDKLKIYDRGNILPDLNWEKYYRTVEDEAYDLIKTGQFCLFLGGDHSVTIPLHNAFGRYYKKNGKSKVGVIHFDSHPDISDTYDGHKWSHACTEARALEHLIGPADLSYVGLRSF